jgi:hypothetical protein
MPKDQLRLKPDNSMASFYLRRSAAAAMVEQIQLTARRSDHSFWPVQSCAHMAYEGQLDFHGR